MILICAVMGSGKTYICFKITLVIFYRAVNPILDSDLMSPSSSFLEPLHKEVQSLAFIDVVSKLRAHENKTVSHQASLTEQRLTAQS